jgi:hypothetical protein
MVMFLGSVFIVAGVFASTTSMTIPEQILIPQEKGDILSHPFPQNAREWMGHPNSIELPDH